MRAVLPDWVPRQELSRPSAEAISRLSNRRQTLTYAGFGAVIPVVYGEQVVSGPVIAGPVVSGSNVILAVALSVGPIGGVLDVRSGETIGNINSSGQGSVSGASVWVYDGTQTSHNTVLSGAIPGFDDVFPGIAYAVIRSSDINVATTLAFRVSGRLNGNENPVRHLRDFVMNSEFGLGMPEPLGYIEARDLADSLYSGLPRSRTGLTIQDPLTAEDALTLLAEYAEVLWSYEGDRVRIVPDAPVDIIHPISPDDMIEGSLSMTTVGLEDIPTQVRIEFTDRADPEWASRPAVAEVPEHTMHGMPTSPSSVPLPGVFSRLEAERRAWQRLWRLQTPGRVEWRMFAPGMMYQAGDVVRLPDIRGLQSVDVRLTAQPEMVAPLLYQMSGEIYRASNYPDSAPGVAVPTGGILIYRGTGAIPDGYSLLNIGNRLVREGSPGSTGTGTSYSASGSMNAAGEHLGTRTNASHAMFNALPPGTDPAQDGMPIHYLNAAGGSASPSDLHTHSVSASFNAAGALPRRIVRWVRREGAPELLSPGLAFFGSSDLSSLYVMEAIDLRGQYLMGGNSESTPSVVTSRVVTTSERADHAHNPYFCQVRSDQGMAAVGARMGRPAGRHSHTVRASCSARLRSVALAVFESLGDAALTEGSIIGWEGTTAPEGWGFCDGSNGTVDMRDCFIYVTESSNAGGLHETESVMSISIGGETSVAGAHHHIIYFNSRTPDGFIYSNTHNPYHDSTDGAHSHHVSGGATHSLDDIQRYQLRFIQYIGDE